MPALPFLCAVSFWHALTLLASSLTETQGHKSDLPPAFQIKMRYVPAVTLALTRRKTRLEPDVLLANVDNCTVF